MVTVEEIVGAIVPEPRGMRVTWRIFVWGIILFFTTCLILISLIFLQNAWFRDDWGNFWLSSLATIPIPIFATFLLRDDADIVACAQQFRETLADEKVMIAPSQPPPPSRDQMIGMTQLGPLPSIASVGHLRRSLMPIWGTFYLFGMMQVFLLALKAVPSIWQVLFFFDGVGYVALGTLFLFTRWGRTRSQMVEVDQTGFSWRTQGQRGAQRSIDWADVRAIGRLNGTGGGTVYYLIETAEQSFAWKLNPSSDSVSIESARTLLGWAIARTGKPMCDGTYLAQALGRQPTKAELNLAPSDDLDPLIAIRRAAHSTRTQRKRFDAGVIAPLLISVIIAPIYLLAAVGQYTQSAYFADTLTHIKATKPLYQDNLVAAQGDWPTSTPSETNSSPSFVFNHAAYQLDTRSSDTPLIVWIPYRVADGAVTVTASIPAFPQKGSFGLVLHLDPSAGGKSLIFAADTDQDAYPTRHLSLSSYANGAHETTTILEMEQDTSFGSKLSSAPLSFEYRLLVVMQGRALILYANEQLIGGYIAPIGEDWPTSGYVGLYADRVSAPVEFNNFKVYPVGPPEWWEQW